MGLFGDLGKLSPHPYSLNRTSEGYFLMNNKIFLKIICKLARDKRMIELNPAGLYYGPIFIVKKTFLATFATFSVIC